MYTTTTLRFSLFFFFFFFSRRMVSVMCLKYTHSLHTLWCCLRNASLEKVYNKRKATELKKKKILLFRVANVVSILRSSAFFFVVVCPPKESASLCFTKKPSKKKEKIDLKLRGRWFSAKEKTYYFSRKKRENEKTVKRSSLLSADKRYARKETTTRR